MSREAVANSGYDWSLFKGQRPPTQCAVATLWACDAHTFLEHWHPSVTQQQPAGPAAPPPPHSTIHQCISGCSEHSKQHRHNSTHGCGTVLAAAPSPYSAALVQMSCTAQCMHACTVSGSNGTEEDARNTSRSCSIGLHAAGAHNISQLAVVSSYLPSPDLPAQPLWRAG